MSTGKYSPTISHSYAVNPNWWRENGGGFDNGNDPNSNDDNDGYDSYGYLGGNGPDRAGYSETDYMTIFEDDEVGPYFYLYERVASEWHDVVLGVGD